jgi:hypothetical protein
MIALTVVPLVFLTGFGTHFLPMALFVAFTGVAVGGGVS